MYQLRNRHLVLPALARLRSPGPSVKGFWNKNCVLTNTCVLLYKVKALMIQKQISLPEALDQQIQERAKRLKASEEQVITTLLEEGLKKPKQQWQNAGDALSSLSELGIRGPKDLARNHEKYLYEDE